MMYPRLKLAKNLLKKDGTIFISIDENEYTNLKKICDEIFGAENFIGDIIRKTKSMTNDTSNGFNLQHEFLVIYSKSSNDALLKGETKKLSNYKNIDNDPNGNWVSGDPSAKSGGKSTYFEIKNPYTNRIDYPPKGRFWAFNEKTLQKYIENGKIKFKKEHRNSERGFIFKRYEKDLKTKKSPVDSLFAVSNEYMNQAATKQLSVIFPESNFSYPKPVSFIEKIVKYGSEEDSIILDFFSGSATTAHAIINLNKELNSNRKYIMIQIPEENVESIRTSNQTYENIAEIGKERIRRAGEKIKKESKNKDLDIGFKVFKLDSSNLNKWDPDYHNLEETLIDSSNNIKEDRTEQDLIYEIMLKYGVDLTLPIEKHSLNGNDLYSIGFGKLVICLDDDITQDIVKSLIELKEDLKPEGMRVVLKDNGFASDSDKANIKETLKNNGVEELVTI